MNHAQTPLAGLFAAPAGANGVTLWWLGQSGFVLAAGRTRIAIDPYLSEDERRTVAPACAPEALASMDAILVTHEHTDHMDLPSLARSAAVGAGPTIVLPAPVADQAVRGGVPAERLRPVQPGEHLTFGAAEIWPLKARHGLHAPPARYDFGEADSDGLVRYLGYVVRLGGVTVFHAGDGLVYDGLADDLRAHGVEVALLPINGRDPEREARDLVGNMDEREAADLAADAGIATLVPMHYEMFAHNPGEPGRLVAYVRDVHPELTIVVPSHLRGVILAPIRTVGENVGLKEVEA